MSKWTSNAADVSSISDVTCHQIMTHVGDMLLALDVCSLR